MLLVTQDARIRNEAGVGVAELGIVISRLVQEANAEAASGASRSIVSRHHLDLLCFDTIIVLR